MSAQGMQTLIVAKLTENAAVVDRKQRPQRVPTLTKVTGCSLQPGGVTETVSETDYARINWNALMPAVAGALSITPPNQLYYDDLDPVTGVKALVGKAPRITANDPDTGVATDYAVLEVIGSQIFYDDNSGVIDHVTVHAKSVVG